MFIMGRAERASQPTLRMATTKSFNGYLSRVVYEQLVPQDHFLRKLTEVVDWYELSWDAHRLADNDHGGRPRYTPDLLVKMVFLSFLYDLSDDDTERFCSESIPVKCFLGLDVTAPAPDATTLSVFRSEVLRVLGEPWLTGLLQGVLRQAKVAGIQFGTIHALDATHVLADVDTHADKERRGQGEPPRDPDARWGCKGTETKLTPDGKPVEVAKFFHGYKVHALAETDHGIVTGLSVSPGNTADVDAGEDLVLRRMTREDRAAINLCTLTADKAYGDAVLIGILERDHGIQTALGLNGQFLKGRSRDHWQAYLDDPDRTAARKQRGAIERIFADCKASHALRRCRYLGLAKLHLQATFATLCHNLKTLVRLQFGIRLRPAHAVA